MMQEVQQPNKKRAKRGEELLKQIMKESLSEPKAVGLHIDRTP